MSMTFPSEGDPSPLQDLYQENAVVFLQGEKRLALIPLVIPEQVPLVVLLAQHGHRGLVRVPHNLPNVSGLIVLTRNFCISGRRP